MGGGGPTGDSPLRASELRTSVQDRLDALSRELEASSSARKSRQAKLRHELEREADHLAVVESALAANAPIPAGGARHFGEGDDDGVSSALLGAFLFYIDELWFTARLAVVVLIRLGGVLPAALRAVVRSGRLTRPCDPPAALRGHWGSPGALRKWPKLKAAQTAWMETQYTRTMFHTLYGYAEAGATKPFLTYAASLLQAGTLTADRAPDEGSDPLFATTDEGLGLLEEEEYTRSLLWYIVESGRAATSESIGA